MISGLLRDPHQRIRPDADIDGFLHANTRSYVFVAGKDDGTVRGWPMTAFYDAGLLLFTTYAKAPKTPHLERADRATVLVVTPEGQEPIEYVEASGPIRVVEFSPEVIDRFMALTAAADVRVDDRVRQRFRQRLESRKRVLVEVDVGAARRGRLDSGEAA